MHIGFLTSEYPDTQRPDGGLGNYIRKTAFELISRGDRVSVFVLSAENKQWVDQTITIYQVKNFRFHWRLSAISFLSSILALIERDINRKKLRDFVLSCHRKTKIDLLQIPNYHAPGYYLCQNGFIPVVCRISSYMPLLRAANGHNRTFEYTIDDWREVAVMLRADALFSPSEYLAKIIERFECVRPKIIRTPVILPKVSHDDAVYNEFLVGRKYLLYFGTLMGVKGIDLLITIAPKLLDNFPDLNIVFIGRNGPIACGGTALDLIQQELGYYRDRVYYFSPLHCTQLYPIIQNALGVAMPSRVDNYPNACLEALALGVPVIGTYDSSLDEIIVEGVTGFLAKNDDSKSLYEAIQRLLTLDELEQKNMKANINKAISSFVAEDRVGQLISFYEETIANF